MRKRSLFLQYFISYLGLSATCAVVFGFAFYYFSSVNLNAEVNSSRAAATASSLGKVDSLLEAMSNIAYHFSTPEVLANYDEFNLRSNLNLTEDLIRHRLTGYEENLQKGTQVSLLYRGDSWIYTSQEKIHYSDFEKQFGKQADLNMSQLYSTVNQTKKPIAVSISASGNMSRQLGVIFAYPIPYMSLIPEASLLFQYDRTELGAVFENYLGEGRRNIYLVDNLYRVVYRSEVFSVDADVETNLLKLRGTGVMDFPASDGKMVVTRALSETTGYSLFVLMDRTDFYSHLDLFREVLLVCISLFFVLSAMLALVLTLRNLRPIRKLLESFSAEDLQGDYNELELIQLHMENSRREKDELGRLIDMQRPYVVLTCLTNILQGKVSNAAELQFQCQCANISFSYALFQVLVVVPSCMGNIAAEIQAILAVCDHIKLEQTALYSAELFLEKRVAVVINSAAAEMQRQNTGLYIGHCILEAMENQGYPAGSIGIGRVCHCVEDVHNSFLESTVAVNEYGVAGTAIFFGDIHIDSSVENQSISPTNQAVLEQALLLGDSSAAWRTLNHILGQIDALNDSVLITQYLRFDLGNILVKAASRMEMKLSHGEIRGLTQFQDIASFQENCRRISEKICWESQRRKEVAASNISSEIINYVHRKFSHNSLSLEQTASHFKFSPSYLSRFFKQATGNTFIQYVTNLRMEYIKGQLVSTNRQIKDIVLSAGYIDVASFVRKFKQAEGITPGQYRERTHSSTPAK